MKIKIKKALLKTTQKLTAINDEKLLVEKALKELIQKASSICLAKLGGA